MFGSHVQVLSSRPVAYRLKEIYANLMDCVIILQKELCIVELVQTELGMIQLALLISVSLVCLIYPVTSICMIPSEIDRIRDYLELGSRMRFERFLHLFLRQHHGQLAQHSDLRCQQDASNSIIYNHNDDIFSE
jgi:hypothetical protein